MSFEIIAGFLRNACLGREWFELEAESNFPGCPSSSSYPDGHIDDLAAQVGNVLADVFGTEMAAERLSHDQPIVFSRP